MSTSNNIRPAQSYYRNTNNTTYYEWFSLRRTTLYEQDKIHTLLPDGVTEDASPQQFFSKPVSHKLPVIEVK